MGLLDDITSDLINPSPSLTDVLRKARVLAYKLDSPELRQWTNSELSGYRKGESLPDYRQRHHQLYGTFQGSLQFRKENVVIPTMGLPEDIRDLATRLDLMESAASLEQMTETGEEEFRRIHQPELTAHLAKYYQPNLGMVLTDSYLMIPKYVLTGVLDNIKNRLLDFILGLQENGIDPESPNEKGTEAQLVKSSAITIIYGDNNLVAIGDDIRQQVSTVHKGDMDSLMGYLKESNVPDNDLEELRQAIADDPKAETGKLGPKVSSWIGRMVAKAASGAWKIGVPVASAMLQKAIESYYGN